MNKVGGSYPIENRAGEIERLRVQGDALAPATRELLAAIGVRHGWHCLDIGCGPGGITGLLSEAVGRAGSVLGIDMDETFLAHAASRAPANVSFKRADAYATGLEADRFDLVHMRFVAGTAGQPDALLKEAIRIARPGGIIALQEPDMTTLRAFPPHPAFETLQKALIGAFLGVGADINGAHNLFGLVRKLGLTDAGYRTHLLGVRSGDPMVDYLPATVESVRATILRLGLLDETSLADALSACRAHLRKPDTVCTMFTVVHIWGRKP